MKLHVLGINGPFPESGGATSGYLLETEQLLLQFDFGSGILGRLTALCPPESLSAILISHWHFDHTSDLLPLIYRLDTAGVTLPVYGPADDQSALRKLVASAPRFDLHTVAPGDTIAFENAAVIVGEARHPVPAVSWRVEAEGKTFGFTGDTNTLPSLPDFFRGCDLLLADGPFPEAAWAENKPHLSAALAAALARDAEARKLVLTHLIPTVSPRVILEEARAVFPAVSLAEAGQKLTI